MRILSLDTSTKEGSVALVEDERVVDVRRGDGSRSHAERLPGELIALLDAHHLSFRDVDVFAVASGPGSFTGLRIGIATIQGLAFTCAKRVVAVSALDALAHQAISSSGFQVPGSRFQVRPGLEPGTWNLEPGTFVVAWIDAHRREVFGAAYRIEEAAPFAPDRLSILDQTRVGPPSAILESLQGHSPAVFAGDGAAMYAADIARVFPSARVLSLPTLADAIGLMALERARRNETIDPAAIQPLYIRRPDAEVARDARG